MQEWFLIECRYQIWPLPTEHKANTCHRRQARENACELVTIGLGTCFSLVEKLLRALLAKKPNLGNYQITSGAQLKPALYI